MPWRTLLARYLISAARDDYSFQRSSRRDGDALLPRLASGEVNVVIAIDTSGSIGEEEMREFASELDALKGQVRANLVLHACDDKLCAEGPWHFAPWDPVTLPKNHQRGRRHALFTGVRVDRARPTAAGSAYLFHRCAGRVSRRCAALSGDLARQGQGGGAVGRENSAELGARPGAFTRWLVQPHATPRRSCAPFQRQDRS